MKCKRLNEVLQLLRRKRYRVTSEETGWSKMNLVVYIDKKLTDKDRHELKEFSNLTYHRMDSDPHYAKEEEFICAH